MAAPAKARFARGKDKVAINVGIFNAHVNV
jgi:hypothetical protein